MGYVVVFLFLFFFHGRNLRPCMSCEFSERNGKGREEGEERRVTERGMERPER
jgi:hypothetical protein